MKKLTLLQLLIFTALACKVHTFGGGEIRTSSESNPELVQVGQRNAWEVTASMAMVTMLPQEDDPDRNDVMAILAAKNSRGKHGTDMMARSNNIDSCDPATHIGLFRLASAYCNRLIEDETAYNNFVARNFDGADVSTLSKSHIAAVMLDSLQTGSRLNSEQREQSLTTIVSYMNDAGDTVSKETLFDVCTMVLGSVATLLN